MKQKVLTTLGAMISTLGFAIASAGPATAQPLEHDHFVDSGSETFQKADPLFCGGTVDFPVRHIWNAEGMFLLVQRGDGLVYGQSTVRATDTYTNTRNGQTFTITQNGRDADHRVTDNGDDTLTLEVAVSGVQKVYGPDGDLLFIDAGMFRFEILIDNGGTPSDPSDDEFLDFLGETANHGRMDTQGRDFCQDLVTYIN